MKRSDLKTIAAALCGGGTIALCAWLDPPDNPEQMWPLLAAVMWFLGLSIAVGVGITTGRSKP